MKSYSLICVYNDHYIFVNIKFLFIRMVLIKEIIKSSCLVQIFLYSFCDATACMHSFCMLINLVTLVLNKYIKIALVFGK